MREEPILSGKELEDQVKKRYREMKEIPLEHLDFIEKHALDTANALNIHLEGSKSKYILILAERDFSQCGSRYSGDEDL